MVSRYMISSLNLWILMNLRAISSNVLSLRAYYSAALSYAPLLKRKSP